LSFEIESKLLINIYLLILKQLNGFETKLISLQTLEIFTAALRNLSYYFIEMVAEPPGCPKRGELSYKNPLTPSKFISIIPKLLPKNADFPRIEEIVQNFLFVVDRISPQMADQDLGKVLSRLYSIRHHRTQDHCSSHRRVGDDFVS
jgi:hypothetical protein